LRRDPESPSQRLRQLNLDVSIQDLSHRNEFMLRWDWSQKFTLKTSMTTTVCEWGFTH